MVSYDNFRKLVLDLPYTEENPHFERLGYKITGKKMFASYLEKDNTANIFLTIAEQCLFCEVDPVNIFPVPNSWGAKGITTFVLNNLEMEIVREALQSAYHDVLNSKPKK